MNKEDMEKILTDFKEGEDFSFLETGDSLIIGVRCRIDNKWEEQIIFNCKVLDKKTFVKKTKQPKGEKEK